MSSVSNAARPKTAVVIEDDADIRALVVQVFQSAGLETTAVANGLDGVEAVIQHQPVVTTLDVSMPGIDGFETARRIRRVSDTIIIMISALSDEADVVLGLGSGADEYVIKPFRPRELRARIEAALRRANHGAPPPEETVAPTPEPEPPAAATPGVDNGEWDVHRALRINIPTRTVVVAEKEIDLTRTEFDLLATLIESKRRVRSKSDLTLVLRGDDAGASYYVGEADKRAVETHMANLRRKLGDNANDPEFIETVRGVGYRLTS
ncbi:MAG: response regulator transcription factor [Microbacterium sp.]|uniref:response regulator transcription factor n=1 Tax=Microbacterium sp. TaxID=51671 RepID=UPI0027246D4D|nr:response regulator transcription factor [Microbacterium sp.]MDO8383307.1 response regulator transcription factor [Microbacterium sp.]